MGARKAGVVVALPLARRGARGLRALHAASRHDPAPLVLSRPFIVCSLLGIAWGLAHLVMEALMGAGFVKVGLPVTAVWALMLVLAVRGQTLAAHACVLLGALGCYWLTMMHYDNMQLHWYGLIPWIKNPEDAGPVWAGPYNVLVYAGLLSGLALLWTGARELNLGLDLRRGWFILLVSSVLVGGGVAVVVHDTGVDLVLDSLRGDFTLPHGGYLIVAQTAPSTGARAGKVNITLTGSRKIRLDYFDSAGTQHSLYGSGYVCPLRSWHTVELRETVAAGTGSLTLLVDGTTVVNGGTTLDLGRQGITRFAVGEEYTPADRGTRGHLYIDDVAVTAIRPLFSATFDGTRTGADVVGAGADQFTGDAGSSRLAVQRAIVASAPDALAVTIYGGGSAYVYKQYRMASTQYDLRFNLQLGRDQTWVYDRLTWVIGVGLGPLIVMTIAVVLPQRKRRHENGAQPDSLWYCT